MSFPLSGIQFPSKSRSLDKILFKPPLVLLSSFFYPYILYLHNKNSENSNGDGEPSKALILKASSLQPEVEAQIRPLAAVQKTGFSGPSYFKVIPHHTQLNSHLSRSTWWQKREPLISGSLKPVSRTILLKLGGSQIFAASAASKKVAQMVTLCAYSQEAVLNIDYTLESPWELLKQQRSYLYWFGMGPRRWYFWKLPRQPKCIEDWESSI